MPDGKSKDFLTLQNLDVYKLSRLLSAIAWQIYNTLHWQHKKILGDQFIQSTDSSGANIAEGYGRYHYLDKIKFYYNARGSLLESKHWFDLLVERLLIKDESLQKQYLEKYSKIGLLLNGLIKSTYKQKKSS